MMQVYEVLGTLEHAVKVTREKIRELQVKVQEQAEQLKVRDKCDYWFNEYHTIKSDLQEQLNAKDEALTQMCFCKKHICERCGFAKELSTRCKNEILRDQALKGE